MSRNGIILKPSPRGELEITDLNRLCAQLLKPAAPLAASGYGKYLADLVEEGK